MLLPHSYYNTFKRLIVTRKRAVILIPLHYSLFQLQAPGFRPASL